MYSIFSYFMAITQLKSEYLSLKGCFYKQKIVNILLSTSSSSNISLEISISDTLISMQISKNTLLVNISQKPDNPFSHFWSFWTTIIGANFFSLHRYFSYVKNCYQEYLHFFTNTIKTSEKYTSMINYVIKSYNMQSWDPW